MGEGGKFRDPTYKATQGNLNPPEKSKISTNYKHVFLTND